MWLDIKVHHQKIKKIATIILFLLSFVVSYGQTHMKFSGETSTQFAEKIKPRNAKLVHSVGSAKNRVLIRGKQRGF